MVSPCAMRSNPIGEPPLNLVPSSRDLPGNHRRTRGRSPKWPDSCVHIGSGLAKPGRLATQEWRPLEPQSRLQVNGGVLKDHQGHDPESRKCAWRCSSVRNLASPRSARARRSARMSSSHAGDDTAASSRQPVSQSCSKACRRSAIDIARIRAASSMGKRCGRRASHASRRRLVPADAPGQTARTTSQQGLHRRGRGAGSTRPSGSQVQPTVSSVRSLRIFRASRSLISGCLGTGWDRPV